MKQFNVEGDILFGRVYMIYSDVDDYTYIGSTTRTLSKKLDQHMDEYSRGFKTELYDRINKYGIQHFKMKLLDWKQISNIKELYMIEQMWRNKFNQKEFKLKSYNINDSP